MYYNPRHYFYMSLTVLILLSGYDLTTKKACVEVSTNSNRCASTTDIFSFIMLQKVSEFGGLHSCTVYYNPYLYFYMSLTGVILPTVLLLTLNGRIVGVVVHRQGKVNASIVPDPAGGVASVLSTTCAVVTILFLACWLPVWIIFFSAPAQVSS